VHQSVNIFDLYLIYYARLYREAVFKSIIFSIIILNIDKILGACYTRQHEFIQARIDEAKRAGILMLNSHEHPKSTRERVLQTLLAHQTCTINEIADAVEINPISVRHHITKLQADGLVDSAEQRHGVGRPRRIYFLTNEGRELFPTRYLRLTSLLLDQLKETVPQSVLDKVFTQIAESMAAKHVSDVDGLSIEQRLDLVKTLLNQEGFSVEWEKQGDTYQIHESNCPYFHIGQSHPEVCSVDMTLIHTLLAVPTEKVKCMLRGDSQCTYIIPASSIMELEKS
jgi:predicted ArsR family transcriptional regulator